MISDGRLNVLHVVTGLATGGTEAMLARLVTRMDSALVRSHVVSLGEGGPIAEVLKASGIPVTVLGVRGIPNAQQLKSFALAVRSARPHVVQGWLAHGNVAATSTLATRLGSRPALVWNIRQALYRRSDDTRRTRTVIRMAASLSRLADAIVYNSDVAVAQHELLGYAADKRIVIPNGFDVDRFRPDPDARRALRAELQMEDSTPLVGLVARYHVAKGHDTFLKTAKNLVASGSKAHFLLAGPFIDTSNSRLSAMIDECGLRDRVHLIGERADIERIYPALDVLTVTSSTEAFPNVLGEAMACGVACVTTDVGAAASIVGDTGIVVSVGDVDALAAAWLQLLSAPRCERDARGQRARQRIANRWPLDRIAEEYRTLYERVAHERGAFPRM
jgi:Glycosyltransferase